MLLITKVISLTDDHLKDTGEVWSDHRRFEGWRRVIPFLEYYCNDVISNVSLSLHLPESNEQRETHDEEQLAVTVG